jgi:hypothetical protein
MTLQALTDSSLLANHLGNVVMKDAQIKRPIPANIQVNTRIGSRFTGSGLCGPPPSGHPTGSTGVVFVGWPGSVASHWAAD